MLEKQETGGLFNPPLSHHTASAKSKLRRTCFIVFALAIYVVVALFRSHASGYDQCVDSTEHRTYPGERIKWTACGETDGHELECSSVEVPMDHFNRSNSGDKSFVLPLVRLRGVNAKRSILVNPGGPGGSGVALVQRKGKLLKEIAGDDFHIIGFDPRGINGSQPAALCYANEDVRTLRAPVYERDDWQYNPALNAWADNFGRACEANAGEHSHYVNTPQTATDMNDILDAIGQKDMYYMGFSYGTVLGQTYAMMYPERSKRIIIDGVCNIFDWYNSPIDVHYLDNTNQVVAVFMEKCLEDDSGCALSSFGDSKDELHSKVMGFINGLKEEPIPVFVNSTVYGVVDYNSIFRAFFTILYAPVAWYSFAETMANLMRGNGTEALLKYVLDDIYAPSMMDHYSFVVFNDKLTGQDHWPQGRNLSELIDTLADMSEFSTPNLKEIYPASRWQLPHTHRFKPPRQVQTQHPILILSQTYDPVTPLVSAKVARDTFQGSHLVEVAGAGHCSIAVHSTCAINATRQFLLHGTFPDSDALCPVDRPYFVSPETLEELKQSESDDDKLWAAQLELSEHLPGRLLF